MSIIPDFVLQSWYDQYAPDAPLWQKYPEVDRQKVLALMDRDRPIVHASCVPVHPRASKQYTSSAGAPLAGKSTVLDQLMAQNPLRYDGHTKTDPDRWGFLFMPNLYHDYLMSSGMLANAPTHQYAGQRAYDVVRPACNILALEVMNEAFDQGRNIIQGSTLTGGAVGILLGNLKKAGYDIELLLCSAEDDVRLASERYRTEVQGLYQAAGGDVQSKGVGFAERMSDYFKYADHLSLFWREGVHKNAVCAAFYTQGTVSIENAWAMAAFIDKYERERVKLMRSDKHLPAFGTIERAYVERFGNPPHPGGGSPRLRMS